MDQTLCRARCALAFVLLAGFGIVDVFGQTPADSGEESAPAIGDAVAIEEPASTVLELPEGVTLEWLDSVAASIELSQYEFSDIVPAVRTALNPSQGFEIHITAGGLTVTSLSRNGRPFELNLAVTGVGRGESFVTMEPGNLAKQGGQIALSRSALVETFSNSPAGLKHSLEVTTVPAGAPGPTQIRLSATGGLAAAIGGDGQTVSFLDGAGAVVLTYAGLVAFDSDGTAVSARFVMDDRTLAIELDDEEAHYPITIDPLLTTGIWSGFGPKKNASFGFAASVAGDVNNDGFSDVIVGAPGYDFDFGQVGDNGTFDEHGAAFLYMGTIGGLQATANCSLGLNPRQPGAAFGAAVSTAGDVNDDGFDDVIIGIPGFSNSTGTPQESAVYVFRGKACVGPPFSGCCLQATTPWIAEGNASGANFGTAVSFGDFNGDAISDVLIGAPRVKVTGIEVGAAFVWKGSHAPSGPGLGTGTADFRVQGDQAGAQFGAAVSGLGNVNGVGPIGCATCDDVGIGAPGWDDAAAARFGQGKLYIFYGRSPLPFSLSAPDWTATVAQNGAAFGTSVAGVGDLQGDMISDLAVGAPFLSDGESAEGGAFVWYGKDGGLTQSSSADKALEGNQAGSLFGHRVATAGDVNADGYADVVISGPLFEFSPATFGEGRAFLYLGTRNGLVTTNPQVVDSDHVGAEIVQFGGAIGSAGDINGDGFGDLLIGSYRADGTSLRNAGKVAVFKGGDGGLSANENWSTSDPESEFQSQYGLSVASAGDINGDGYSDVVVGAPTKDTVSGGEDAGTAYVYHGSPIGLPTTPNWTVSGGQHYVLGTSVSSAGDVNGDGYGDVIIGAHGADGDGVPPLSLAGKVFVYFGTNCGLFPLQNQGSCTPLVSPAGPWVQEGPQTSAGYGDSVANAGDIDGDGDSEILIAAPQFLTGAGYVGRAWLYLGSATGPTVPPAWDVTGSVSDGGFGLCLGPAGDVNADGDTDFLVGAPFEQAYRGTVYVYYGTSGVPSTTPSWIATGDQNSGYFGAACGTAGDVNRDRWSDIVVGAPYYTNSAIYEGGMFVFHGSASGLDKNGTRPIGSPANADWKAFSGQAFTEFGRSVWSAGDVNPDGFADVVVGAPSYSNTLPWQGAAFIFRGGSTGLDNGGLRPVGNPGNADWIGYGAVVEAGFGYDVRTAGDVNGDGVSDVLIGAPCTCPFPAIDTAHLFLGNSDGVALAPRQARSSGGPLFALGSAGAGSFHIQMYGRSPEGRASVRMEYEVRPFAQAFNAAEAAATDWFDTGAPGAGAMGYPFDKTVTLTAYGQFKWRARISSKNPYFPHSRWFSIPANGPEEEDFLRLP